MKVMLLNILFAALAGLSLFAQEPVKIGLLIQDNDQKAALRAAELAIKHINLQGGINGRKVELVCKSMEGPWGTGSKQAVDLIWSDKVCALVASCDGRNAHLVEQASAKSIMPMISAWSTDPTLSHAFIPWFYNCLPNDEQQGSAIAEEIFVKRRLKRPLIITDKGYDSQKALSGYKRYAPDKNGKASLILNFETDGSTDEFTQSLNNAKPDCIIILAGPESAREVIQLLKSNNSNLPVFGTLQVLNENILSETEYTELKNTIVFTCNEVLKPDYSNFSKLYNEKYKRNPGLVAAFAYDAVNLLIRAITVAGSTENEQISKALSGISYEGVTGNFRFTEWGVRQGSCYL